MGARVALTAAVLWSMFVGLGTAAEEPTTTRVFMLRHRPVVEAAQVIQPLLSEDGTLTFHPQRSSLTVEDRPEVVEKVAEVLGEFDREPAGYRLRIDLLEGRRVAGGISGETVAVAEKVERIFPYAAYRRLASAVVEGRIGERGGVELGELFTLRFHSGPANLILPDGVTGRAIVNRGRGGAAMPAPHDSRGRPWPKSAVGRPVADRVITPLSNRFRLQQLTLLKWQETGGGDRELVEVFRSNVTLAPGQSVVVGASASEESERALVLIIAAESMEGE